MKDSSGRSIAELKLKKVRIVVQSVEDTKIEWAKALRGEIRSIQKPGMIIFASLEAVAKMLSPARLELLGAILKEHPESILMPLDMGKSRVSSESALQTIKAGKTVGVLPAFNFL